MNIFSIGFDEKQKLEFLSVLAPEKKNNKYYFSPSDPIDKPIGTFLLEFINLNLDSKKDTEKFIYKYLLGYYLIIIGDLESLIENEIPFSKKDIEEYLNDSYYDLKKQLKKVQEDFISGIEHTFIGVADLIKENHKEGYRNADYSDCYLSELYATLHEYSDHLFIDFDFPDYCYLSEPDDNDEYYANVEMGFGSYAFESILYISLRKLIFIKNILILRCENCHDFFIPDSLHYPKYCNKIYENGKTCKEIGARWAYKQKLENDDVLKKYRSRYSSLASNASNYPDNFIAVKRFNDYKEIGPIKKNLYLENKISKEEFNSWIDSTKIRKN